MRLLIRSEGKENEWINLEKRKYQIGRDPSCDISINDPRISRTHAEIDCRDGKYVFWDQNSTNGSSINGKKVINHELRNGDIIQLGDVKIEVSESADTGPLIWNEEEPPVIAAQMPLDMLDQKISEISALFRRQALESRQLKRKKRPAGETPLPAKTQKLLNNLDMIYRLSNEFTTVMARDDLNVLIEKHIYEIFPYVERFCILEPSGKDSSDFISSFLSARDPWEKKKFQISSSIFQQVVDQKVSILITDASSDQRFGESESIVGMNLRSAMCAPLVVNQKIIGAIWADNRTEPACFDNEDLEMFCALANQAATALENARLYEELQRSYHEVILAMINAIEAKDPYTRGHTSRTSRYCMGIAVEMNLDPSRREKLKTAAELHDIGKIGLKEKILFKKEELTNTEYYTIQQHVIVGENILRPITYLHYALPIIRGHHEHYDGTGYPDGLEGEEILLESRILSLADSFDAMTTQRPYNDPLTFSEALEECRKNSGTHFDPEVVEALCSYISNNFDLSSSAMFHESDQKEQTPGP